MAVVSEVGEPLSSVGMERSIPLVFIKLYDGDQVVTDPSGVEHHFDDHDLYDGIRRNVAFANSVWRAAGVQWWVKAIIDCGWVPGETGHEDLNWAPDISNTVVACPWGAPGDVPIGGVGSSWRETDSPQWRSRMTVYHATGNADGRVRFKQSGTDCSGSVLPGFWMWDATPRTQVFSVRDMGGDGLPEIWMVYPDIGKLVYILSADRDFEPNIGFRCCLD